MCDYNICRHFEGRPRTDGDATSGLGNLIRPKGGKGGEKTAGLVVAKEQDGEQDHMLAWCGFLIVPHET